MAAPVILRPSDPDPEVAAALRLGEPRRRWWPWLLVVASVVAAAMGIRVLTGAGAASPWETAPIERGHMVLRVTAVGTVEPRDAVDISSELSGIVREVLVDVNQTVMAGQVLARLDADMLTAQLRQADAQVSAAEATLRQAKVSVESARLDKDRTERLAPADATSAADEARAARRQAVARRSPTRLSSRFGSFGGAGRARCSRRWGSSSAWRR